MGSPNCVLPEVECWFSLRIVQLHLCTLYPTIDTTRACPASCNCFQFSASLTLNWAQIPEHQDPLPTCLWLVHCASIHVLHSTEFSLEGHSLTLSQLTPWIEDQPPEILSNNSVAKLSVFSYVKLFNTEALMFWLSDQYKFCQSLIIR